MPEPHCVVPTLEQSEQSVGAPASRTLSRRSRQAISWRNALVTAGTLAALLLSTQATAVRANLPGGENEEAQVSSGILVAQPTSLVFSGVEGEPCSAHQTITVVSATGQSVPWEITSNASWVQTSAGNGVTPSQIDSSVDCASLASGVYDAVLTVSSPTAINSPLTVNATLIVNPAVPVRLSTWKDGRRGAFSASTDDSLSSGYAELLANGLAGTFVMNGTQPPSFYPQMFNAGMELGSHLVSHYCHAVDEPTLRYEIEANVDGVVAATQSLDEVISLVWPCGFTTPSAQVVAAEYFLSARGYNINELEERTPANWMNLKSFNSHEHTPFPPADLKSIVDAAEAQGKWANLVLHAFTNDDGAIAYSKTKNVWAAPIGSVVKYILQRDRTIITNYSETGSTIGFTFARLPVPSTVHRDFEAAIKATDLITFQVDMGAIPYVSGVTVAGEPVSFQVRDENGHRYLYFSTPVTTSARTAEIGITSVVPPILSVSHDSFELTANEGDVVPDQMLQIANSGGGALTWIATVQSEGPNWLTVTPASGTGPGSVSVSASATGLTAGTYVATVTIAAPGAVNSPRAVTVTLKVFPAGTEHYTLNHPDRASLLAAGWDFLARTASGGARDTEQSTGATVIYDASGTLRIPVDTGDLWASANDTRNSLFRDLPPGWTSVRVRLDFLPTSSGQQATVVLYQDDDNYVQLSRILAGGHKILFEHEAGGDPSVLAAASIASGAQLWLRMDRSNATGSITGQYSLNGAIWQTLGEFTPTLTSPRLGLVVGGSPGGFPLASFRDIHVLPDTEPVLAVGSASLGVAVSEGAPATERTIAVGNSGGGVLQWTAAVGGAGPAWLSVSPATGTAPDTLAVTIDPAGLPAGTYARTLIVTAPGALNSPQTVPVTLTVTAAGTAHYVFDYPDRASLLAAGWDFLARTASGGTRNTEQTSGAVVSYHPSGTIRIPADVGDLWASLNDTRNSLFRDLPADWASVRVRLDFAPVQTPQQAGIVVYDNDDNYVHVTRIFNQGQLVVLARETGGAAAVLSTAPVTATTDLLLRLDRDTATGVILGLYSLDSGATWHLLGSVGQTFTHPRLGLIVGASPGGFPNATIHAVQVTVDTTPALTVGSASLSVAVSEGAPATERTITVGNSGGGVLQWTAAVGGTGPAWLSVSPTTGTAPNTLAVTIDPTGLPEGTYTRSITVTAPGALNSPQTVPVTLTVTAAGTAHYVFDYPNRASLLAAGWDFLARTASGSPRNTEQTSGAVVSYAPTGALRIPADVGDLWAGLNDTRNSLFRDLPADWASVRVHLDFAPTQTPQQAGIVVYDDDDNYVQVTRIFNHGQLMVLARETGGAAAVLSTAPVTATTNLLLRLDRDNATGVILGLYSLDSGTTWHLLGSVGQTFTHPRLGLIVGASPGGFPDATIHAVQVTVDTTPALTVGSASLSVAVSEGAPASERTITVGNSGGGVLHWTAAVGGTGPAWLSVSPATGTAPDTLAVTLDATGLTAGTYTRTITVTAPGALNSPQTVPVTLTVSPAGTTHYVFDYPDRASLLAAGWDFLARTASGGPRDTEQTSGAVVSYAPSGALRIPADVGDLWGSLNDTRNSLFRDLPTDWVSVRVRLDFAPTQTPQQAGLVVYDDDDNYVHVTRIFNHGQLVVLARETGGAAAVLSTAAVTAPTDLLLRLDRDPATGVILGLYSLDSGATWHLLGSVGQTFTHPRLGLIVGASPGGFPEATIHAVDVLSGDD